MRIFKLREISMSKESCIKRSKEGRSKNSQQCYVLSLKQTGEWVCITQKHFSRRGWKKRCFFSQKNQKRKNKMVKEKVLKLANIIRSGIEQMDEPFSSWPPLLEEVDYHHMKLLKLIKLLINSLLSKSFPVGERVEKMSNSLEPDIIYNMSDENTKTIKHVQLDITTKKKTGSRLMPSCSYDEVNNIETSFSELNVKNDRLYQKMSSLHLLSHLSMTTVTITQKHFLAHLSMS